MNNKCFLSLILCVVLGLLVSNTAQAKLANLNEAEKALKKKQWAAAEAVYDKYFDQMRCSVDCKGYGELFFKKGWCELKQQKWKEAANSFEQCYKKFLPSLRNPNKYHKISLKYWADACFQMGEYEDAARLYQKYLAEK
ncbi:MAG: tetratricopeptide repeat protein [Akkermansiaceae bacterium]